MRGLRPTFAAVAAVIVVSLGGAAPAHAYEFWLRAQTIGHGYQLRGYRLVGPDLFHDRRRFSQTLALRIVDIGDLAAERRRARRPDRGLRISWHSYLRVDHDFGTYAGGRIRLSEALRRDALDVIPELADSVASPVLLYGYAELAGFADDRATFRFGRVLADDGWGTSGVDGASARVELPPPVAVSATAGLRVRASSLLGVSAFELDGTQGARCREYVAGATPGTGEWRLIDRNRAVTNAKLTSDYELCPQRDVRQPTIGASIATSRLRRVGAELGYRRTWSASAALYPDDLGPAPATGVNEERMHARVHADVRAGGLGVRPYANARYSLLHAALDRADAGVQLSRGAHTLEPSVEYFLPTFDGDSIFNVFSIEPTRDARLGYRFDGAVRVRANAWLRRYAHEDGAASLTAGADAGIERRIGPRWQVAADALFDDGYGGRRAGGSAQAAWRATRDVWLRGRAVVLDVVPEAGARYVATSNVMSTTWRIADGAALHVLAEVDHDARHRLQTRGLVVIDLAFLPEP